METATTHRRQNCSTDRDLASGCRSYLAVPLKNPRTVLGHWWLISTHVAHFREIRFPSSSVNAPGLGAAGYRNVTSRMKNVRDRGRHGGSGGGRLLRRWSTHGDGSPWTMPTFPIAEDGTRFVSRRVGQRAALPPFDVPVRGPCETVLTRQCAPPNLGELYPHVN